MRAGLHRPVRAWFKNYELASIVHAYTAFKASITTKFNEVLVHWAHLPWMIDIQRQLVLMMKF